MNVATLTVSIDAMAAMIILDVRVTHSTPAYSIIPESTLNPAADHIIWWLKDSAADAELSLKYPSGRTAKTCSKALRV